MVAGILGTRRRMREVEAADAGTVTPTQAEDAGSILSVLRRFTGAIRTTPNIGRLLLVALLVLFTNSVINQLSLHLATYFWQLDPHGTQTLLMAGVVGTLIAMPIAPAFMRRVGTRKAMIGGLAAFFLVQAAAIVLPLAGLAPPPASASIGTFVFVARLLGGLAYGLYVVPFNTVTYDIGDEHEANTGTPQQGLVASFMFIGLQVGSGLVSLLAGSFLAIIDFPAGLPVEAMPADKVRALAWFVAVLILVAGSAMALLVGGFKVSAEKQAAIRARLAASRAQAAENAAPAP